MVSNSKKQIFQLSVFKRMLQVSFDLTNITNYFEFDISKNFNKPKDKIKTAKIHVNAN